MQIGTEASKLMKMPITSGRSVRSRKAGPVFDKYLITPNLVFAYCLIVAPMLMFLFPGKDVMEPRIDNKIFWPLVAAGALACLASANRTRLTWPPHIVWLGAYLALAGASVLWAFKPGISFSRFSTETMLLMAIIPPAMLSARTTDMIRGVFFCFLFGSILNALLILGGYSSESLCEGCGSTGGILKIGYVGYFTFKGELGEFAALAFLLSLYEMFFRGWRRAFGLLVAVISIYLVVVSQSKGSLGCALLAAILATFVVFICKKTRLSPMIVLLPLPIGYAVLSRAVGDLVNRISWYLYGNYTLSGRMYIWDFVDSEIAKKPFVGWGYRSFWLVGPDSPPLTDAAGWGWVAHMPSSHNGYLETILDTGYIGLAVFVVFILTTFNAIGRVADRDPRRGWLLLSLALFIVLVNFLEAIWMRGQDTMWLMFVVVVAEAARYWRPFPRGSRLARPIAQRPAVVRRRPAPAKADVIDGLPRPQDVCT